MNDDRNTSGPYLPPGTKVRIDGLEQGGPEYGIVVHCWLDDEIGTYDCYVAFFGNQQPIGKPIKTPYILRYFSTTLAVIENTAD